MKLPLSPGTRSALLIVDMQEFTFRQPERRRGLEVVINNINRLIDYFDSTSQPVFHIITCFKADGSNWDLKMKASGNAELIEGTPEAAILPQIQVSAHHRRLIKTRYSAFFKTGLAEMLHEEGVRRVVVVGAYTHYCVNATVFDAWSHDFVPGLVTDGVISHLEEEARLMIDRMRRNGFHVGSVEEFVSGKI
jgi:nicotinamidase-related amidase